MLVYCVCCFLSRGASCHDAQSRRAEASPPQWVWEGFAQFAPGAAELAARGLDLSAAAAYFDVRAPAPLCHAALGSFALSVTQPAHRSLNLFVVRSVSHHRNGM